MSRDWSSDVCSSDLVATDFEFGTDTDADGNDDLLQRASRIKFAIHEASGILYAAVLGPVNGVGIYNLPGDSFGLIGLFRTENFGGSWTTIAVPTSTDSG